MSEHRIILANGSRLLREMLNRILRRTRGLSIVREVSDQNDLPAAIQEEEAEWLIMSLPEGGKVPEWVDVYMLDHPAIRVLTVSPDGGRVKLKWLECRERDLVDPSLDDLIHVIERGSSYDLEVRH